MSTTGDWGHFKPNRKPVSARQLAANRRNAPFGGPKTPEGKARAAGNATKHGCYAGSQPIDKGHLHEDQAYIDGIRDSFTEALRPTFQLLRDQIDVLVTCWLRLERFRKLETLALTEMTTNGLPAISRDESLEDLDFMARAIELLAGDLDGLEAADWDVLLTVAAMYDPDLADLHARVDPDEPGAIEAHRDRIIGSLSPGGLSPAGAARLLGEVAERRRSALPEANQAREAAGIASTSPKNIAQMLDYSRMLERLTRSFDAEVARYEKLRKLTEQAGTRDAAGSAMSDTGMLDTNELGIEPDEQAPDADGITDAA